jgi:hypothetical protein
MGHPQIQNQMPGHPSEHVESVGRDFSVVSKMLAERAAE